MRHELLTGVEYLKEDPSAGRWPTSAPPPGPVQVRPPAPVPRPTPTTATPTAPTSRTASSSSRTGAATVGVRRDEMRSSYQAPVGTAGASTSYRGDFRETATAPVCPGSRRRRSTTTSAGAIPSVRPPTSTSSPAAPSRPSAPRSANRRQCCRRWQSRLPRIALQRRQELERNTDLPRPRC